MALSLTALLAPPLAAADRRVSPGLAYGGAIFTGMFTGALVGAATGTLPYAQERQNQDPNSIMMGGLYGALAGAAILGTATAAYEVASDKPGSAKSILFNTFGFAVLGGAVGAAGGMISYRHKVDYDPKAAEDFLAAAAGGVLSGAIIGFGVGIYEGVFWEGNVLWKAPGKGIHARLGVLDLAMARQAPEGWIPETNVTLADLRF